MQPAILQSSNGREQGELSVAVNNQSAVSTTKPFIEANSLAVTLKELKEEHIIPVFSNNEPLISHFDFVRVAEEVTHEVFHAEKILTPSLRVSHPVMGRVPEAKDKPAQDLQPWEKTLYYQRMAFVIEVPTISDSIEDQKLSLTIGGVKSYHKDNLNARKGSDEHFQFFIGFKVCVCTNLCVYSDGYSGEIKVKNIGQLKAALYNLLISYDAISNVKQMEELSNYSITENQFAQLVGKCRMYRFLSSAMKKQVPELLLGDSQLSMVAKDYYKDQSFSRKEDGSINLWRVYNLLTSANKQTYIDQFVDRAVNATYFTSFIKEALKSEVPNWYVG